MDNLVYSVSVFLINVGSDSSPDLSITVINELTGYFVSCFGLGMAIGLLLRTFVKAGRSL